MTNKVPEGWEPKAFVNFAVLQRGFDLPVQNRIDGNIPVIASNGIVGSHNEIKLQGPGVVTGRSGTIGKVQLFANNYWPLNTTLYVKDFKGNLPEFTYWFLQHFRLERFATGTGVPTLNRNIVHQEPIVIPPLPEQEKIAEILGSVDEAIAATKAVIAQTQQVKKGLLQTLLTKGIGHTEFKDTELGPIPTSWEVAEVGSLFDIQLGKMLSKKAKQGTNPKPYLRNANVQWNQILTDDLYEMDFTDKEETKFRLKKGDLIMCEGGEVGRCAIWNSPKEMYYQKALHRLRPKSTKTSAVFMKHLFENIFRHSQLANGIIGHNSIAHLTKEKLIKLKVPHPPRKEQDKISLALEFCDIDKLQKHLAQLETLKSGLMSDLLTGRKRVKV